MAKQGKDLEPIPELDVCRSASKFFVCRSSKTAGSLYGFQGFRAKADEKFAGKMRADNSGIGSKSVVKRITPIKIDSIPISFCFEIASPKYLRAIISVQI
jgi:hypothetical protein